MNDKVSILIPSRNEKYLQRTIDDIVEKATGDYEIIVVLDGGNWPDPPLRDHPRQTIIRHNVSRGMRASINAAAMVSSGFYLLKCDAHVMFAPGFDRAMVRDCPEDSILIPRRYRLDPEQWEVIEDGRPPIDYEYMASPKADKPFQGKQWGGYALQRQEVLDDDTPTFQGSCWMMERRHFNFLEGMDEGQYGAFFNEAQELSLKTWLSGGCVIVTKNTWYAHWHKPERGYSLENGLRERATQGLKKWTNGRGWHKQTLPLSFLTEKFPTMPGWPEPEELRLYDI